MKKFETFTGVVCPLDRSNVDTDAIIPARYLNVSDPDELAAHCMEDIDLEFVKQAAPGDIIVATTNFGCGSSREHAPLAIKTAGVSCVIAETFARIFFRNAINIGLPLLECPEAVAGTSAGDEPRHVDGEGDQRQRRQLEDPAPLAAPAVPQGEHQPGQ